MGFAPENEIAIVNLLEKIVAALEQLSIDIQNLTSQVSKIDR